jgi:putative flippase GtrA
MRGDCAATSSASVPNAAPAVPRDLFQIGKYVIVGLSGYLLNLAVYAALVRRAGVDYLAAAPLAFIAAVTNNYLLNRIWTFRNQRGHFVLQGARFFVVALCALVVSLLILKSLVELGIDAVLAQAIAIVVVTPINFLSNKLWSFGR